MEQRAFAEGGPACPNVQSIRSRSTGFARSAGGARGHRFTEQRGAVHRFLSGTDTHPTAEDVFQGRSREELPAISLATVYKNLETLVGCGMALKLTWSDGSSRYDGRTDPHHHARCDRVRPS